MSAVLDIWQQIVGWARERAPETLVRLRPPAREDELVALERTLGHDLPGDYREWLGLHDGFALGGPGPLSSRLFAVEDVMRTWTMMADLARDPPIAASRIDADAGVRRAWWHESWLPIAGDGAGGYLCLDLAPARGGREGQVVELSGSVDRRSVVADSFCGLLRDEFDRLRAGALVVAEWGGFFFRIMDRTHVARHLAIRGEPRGPDAAMTPEVEAAHVTRELIDSGALRFRVDAYVPVALSALANQLRALDFDDQAAQWALEAMASSADHLAIAPPQLTALVNRRREHRG